MHSPLYVHPSPTDFLQASRLRAAFRRHDKGRAGTVKQGQWVVVLRETKLSSVMTRQVAEAICLEHDTRADGTLDYASLCDDIFAGDFDHYAHQQHFVYKVSSGRSPFTGVFRL